MKKLKGKPSHFQLVFWLIFYIKVVLLRVVMGNGFLVKTATFCSNAPAGPYSISKCSVNRNRFDIKRVAY